MTSTVLVDIQEEVTCPICLELLTEPLSLDCGHSFCQACITPNSRESGIGQEGERSCPVCQTSYQLGNLRPNRHLANIAGRLREVVLGAGKPPKAVLCADHGEKLQLFCKDDGKVICWLCERSEEHRGHHTFLMEEVAQEYQEKFQESLKKLKKEQQEAEKLTAFIREKRMTWKNQMEPERCRIQTEFNQLRNILDRAEQRELKKLEEEERKGLCIIEEAENDLVHQSQSLRELISDLERRCQGSTMELLQDMSGIVKWSDIWRLRKPKTLSQKLKTVFHAPDLSRMLQMFRELTAVRCYWVDVTMNPVNLNLNLVLSEDQRQVISVPIWPFKCDNFGILGSQYFSSGKHYWEVDVSKKTAWILGVYCRTRSRNIKYVIRRRANHQNVYFKYRPLFGYWVIGLENKCKYRAFEQSLSSDSEVLTLSMAVPPCRVGVFLDYDAGIVSFFNVTSHGSLIYEFSKCCFSQPVYPYFNPWKCPAPMTLCPPSS
uniref:Tripartite motif-containing protein 5 n=1 Tax=Saimiri boliviensis boliviensis TaxID=39432 RepID=A0A2K6UNJ0_SAIBB